MQVRALLYPNDIRCRAISDLVEDIGRTGFSTALFALAHDMVHADHVTAFCAGPTSGIRTVLAENIGTRQIAREVANRYIRHHWTFDPVQRVLPRYAAAAASEQKCVVIDIDASDVEHPDYRDDCYSSVNLNHRLSIANVREGRTMRVNFYRRRGRDFSQEDVARIMDLATPLVAMVWRHDEEYAARDPADLEIHFLRRLARLAPNLTKRERQVCALVALGLTSEGIALRLGIGLSSVLTYRKRAYARMAISSQNELIRRLMR